jgi:formyltetrahydrofolate deformylase
LADHCLNDLLYRPRIDQLLMYVAAAVFNHPDLKFGKGSHELPFLL